MKINRMYAVFFLAVHAGICFVEAGVQGYLRFPAIHKDLVVFAVEGNLWTVFRSEGLATRPTSHNGDELYPAISPDGNWLAFYGRYQGNPDVFVMSVRGGEPRRLTYHPSTDHPITWKDNDTQVFRSVRESFHGREPWLHKLPVSGGPPCKIKIGPAAIAAWPGDGNYIAFNRLSREFHNWKRYQGETAEDMWLGNLNTNSFEQLTDWEGADRFPMGFDGMIHFLSDRNGTMNLYRMNRDGSNVQPMSTLAKYDMRWSSMFDGRIVFMLADDPSSERDVQITALSSQNELIYRDRVRRNREDVEPVSGGRYGYIHIPDTGACGLVKFSKSSISRTTGTDLSSMFGIMAERMFPGW